VIVNNSRVNIDQTVSSGTAHTSVLRFTQIEERDGGVYKCGVSILDREASNSTEIHVQEGLFPILLVQALPIFPAILISVHVCSLP